MTRQKSSELSADAMGPVHFWLPTELEELGHRWDPDRDPFRYQSGVGHAIIELYRRLSDRKYAVSIGPSAPKNAHVILHLSSIFPSSDGSPDARRLRKVYGALRTASRVTIIRGDVPIHFVLSVPGAVEVMPNTSSLSRPRQVWIPLLPQRGMIRRSPERFGSVRTVGMMANLESVPSDLAAPEFEERLHDIGVEWAPEIRIPQLEDSELRARWHDFSAIDAVLCLRADPWDHSILRKPATKLVNAWVADTIPLIPDEPAYLELSRPGVDAIVVNTVDEVLEAVRRLTDSAELVRQLEVGIAERAEEFSHERVLERWVEMIYGSPEDALSPIHRAYCWFQFCRADCQVRWQCTVRFASKAVARSRRLLSH